MLRLVLPLLFLGAFSIAAFSLLHHRQASALPPDLPSVVMIDPGHGGYDPGVLSDSYREADLTLAIGQKLRSALAKQGISASMTRETDTDYAQRGMRGRTAKRADLDKRLAMTKESQAQLFISLHANVSTQATRGGAEVFYNEAPGAKELGEAVQNALQELPEMSKRDARPAQYYVLNNQQIPALIIECGYLSIASERERLLSSSYQDKIAAAVAKGIVQYVESGT
jgi:N-acetylmuramoyl-L-alanine amidase